MMSDKPGDMPRRDFLATAGLATAGLASAAASLKPGEAYAQAAVVKNEASKGEAKIEGGAPNAAANLDMSKVAASYQLIEAGKAKMSAAAWNYLVGGAETETTIKRNRYALDALTLRSRVLTGVADVDPATTFLGQKLRMPVMLSGVGSIALMHPDGNFAGAKAAGKFGVPLGVSSVAKQSLEDTAAAHPGMKLLQLYVNGDDKWTDAIADRIIAAKYDVLVFTVDSPVFSRRERDIVTAGNNAGLSDRPNPFRAGLTWDKVKRMRDKVSIPIGIKGITTPEDADLACEMGCQVVWVSNHGGRQLDHARGSIDMLAEVAPAVRKRAAIVVDSGFQRGSDIVKALALGADVVGVGKLWSYAIGAGGEAGVTRLLELLEKEVVEAMALAGVSKVADLNPGFIRPAPPVTAPGQFSAFPFLTFA